jgi:uncharacterized protein YdiU (UPF0061 family)
MAAGGYAAEQDGASLAKTMQEFASTADLSWLRELNADPEAAKNAPNRTSREVKSGHFVPVKPKALPNPKLILTSPVMAKQLGLSDEACRSKEFTQFFSGDIDAVPGFKSWATPYALAIMGNPHYNNCPFGNGNGYGDGRAVSVGEIVAPGGQRWELQLKGGGQTPFCRGADGRAVLRSSIREFLASEAMYHLGIDTTRALSLIVSGSETSRRNWYSGGSAGGNMEDPRIANAPPELRQMLRSMMNQQSGEPDMVVNEACAITCRVAPSFTRIGHLDLFARRASKRGCSDAQREEHRMMLQHAFNREYADVMPDAPLQQRALAVYEAASRRIARMVAGWVRVGFCQGNFNCDNCLLGGRTMDYGPFGFIDKYDPGFAKWVGSGDHFAFMNQPGAALANLGTLATALEPILDSAGKQQLQTLVTMSKEIVKSEMDTMWSRKLGFPEASPSSVALFNDLEQLMRNGSVDYTVLFRQLSGLPDAFGSDPSAASSEAILRPLLPAFYGPAPDSKDTPDSWVAWLRRWLTQLSSDGVLEGAGKLMRSENPKYILREYMLVDAYKMAQGGDYSRVEELYSLIRHPFEEQPEFEEKYYRRCPNEALETPGTSVMT